jgi:hypothetical protein
MPSRVRPLRGHPRLRRTHGRFRRAAAPHGSPPGAAAPRRRPSSPRASCRGASGRRGPDGHPGARSGRDRQREVRSVGRPGASRTAYVGPEGGAGERGRPPSSGGSRRCRDRYRRKSVSWNATSGSILTVISAPEVPSVLAWTNVSPSRWKNRTWPAAENCFWPMNANPWSPSSGCWLASTPRRSILSPCARLRSRIRSGAAGRLSLVWP